MSSGDGRIVNMSSVLGRFGVPGYAAYCTAKHGIIGFTRALALELAPRGITVNALCPGWVQTDMADQGIRETAAVLGVSPGGVSRAGDRRRSAAALHRSGGDREARALSHLGRCLGHHRTDLQHLRRPGDELKSVVLGSTHGGQSQDLRQSWLTLHYRGPGGLRGARGRVHRREIECRSSERNDVASPDGGRSVPVIVDGGKVTVGYGGT